MSESDIKETLRISSDLDAARAEIEPPAPASVVDKPVKLEPVVLKTDSCDAKKSDKCRICGKSFIFNYYSDGAHRECLAREILSTTATIAAPQRDCWVIDVGAGEVGT